jgi:ABC-type transport system substrate-binding protein
VLQPRLRPAPAVAAVAFALTALGPAACGGDAADAGGTASSTRATPYDPRSLDPALSTDVPTGRAVSYLFDGLTRFTPDARVEPALAERWDVSPDGRTYTFHLRRGVVFHDGTPFAARHVARAGSARSTRSTAAGAAGRSTRSAGARELAEGKADRRSPACARPTTARWWSRSPSRSPSSPSCWRCRWRRSCPTRHGPDFGQRPVGTGPWKFVEWRHDDYLKFARNEKLLGRQRRAPTR